MKPVWALVWAGACHGVFRLIVAAFAWLRAGTLDIVTLGAAQALAYLICISSIFVVHDPGAPLKPSLGLRPTHPGLGLVGVALGVALKLPAESLSSLVERLFPSSEAQLLSRAALYQTDTLAQVTGLLVIVCLIAPLVEELLFRGALYGRLARESRAMAGALSGALFVVTHAELRHWPALFVVAAVLSYLRVTSGSILPCLGLHVAFNTVGVFAFVTGAASPTRAIAVEAPTLAASWLCAGVLLGLVVWLADDPDAVRARAEDKS